MAHENLLYEKRDGIGFITFNRPKVLNALNRKTMEELRDILTAVREDDEFQRNTIDAELVVDGFHHAEGVTNEEIARQMALYQESIARVPQTA